jgi:hypothetical protein
MTTMKIGRNDPCSCGSGKKYKHCCLSPASVVADELHTLLAGQELDSLEDMQVVADDFMSSRNQQEQDDFCGLSPDQMYRLLYFPFDSPDLYHFPETLSIEPEAPILTLVNSIEQAIDDKGLKATAKGNLPQKLCRDAAEAYLQSRPPEDIRYFIKADREDNFPELNFTRITLELAGLLRKTKGRFYLTRKFKRLRDASELAGLYPEIFKAYCQKFNWAYLDGYPEIHFIQQSFLFTLFVLSRYGENWKLDTFYEDCFLQAFPMAVDGVEPTAWSSAEDGLRNCFNHRTLNLFLDLMGLASFEKLPGEKPFSRNYQIRKRPLLDEVVKFGFRFR